MDLFQQARAEIDAVDAEMAALFEQRMQPVAARSTLQSRDRQTGI